MEKKYNIKLIIVIAIVMTTVISATYAFVNFIASKQTEETKAGCFIVNYTGNILTNTLVSTTNYLEGSHAQITLSKNENCKIYTTATIYAHTTETTAPINTIQALKYKVFEGTTEKASGVITTSENSNEVSLTSVVLEDTPKTYDIYIWVDKDISKGEYNNKTYSGYLYASSNQSSDITQ